MKVTQTVGMPHETLGELVVTCIVPHEGATLDEDAVRNFAREKLASYKVPRRVLFFRRWRSATDRQRQGKDRRTAQACHQQDGNGIKRTLGRRGTS